MHGLEIAKMVRRLTPETIFDIGAYRLYINIWQLCNFRRFPKVFRDRARPLAAMLLVERRTENVGPIRNIDREGCDFAYCFGW